MQLNYNNKNKDMNKKLLDYFNQDELAASVWLGKYAVEGEESPDDTHRRMSKEFWRVEKKYQDEETKTNPPWEENKKQLLSKYGRGRANLTEEAIYNLFKDFKYIVPQGRVMAGLGVKDSYRSLSNCLRLPSPNDSYSSIMYVDTLLVNAAKRGMGFGLGLSKLRPKGLSVTNAAKTTTGIIPFMERFSNSTREVGQDSRRGASLQDIDIRHPDSLDFITSKKDLTKITGSNISVFMPDDFMRAVENDEDYILRFPCDRTLFDNIDYSIEPYNELIADGVGYFKKIKAREHFNTLIETIKVSSEPGVFFRDTMTDYSPSNVYKEYFELGTNACGEQPMSDYDTCRLILLNLYSYIDNPFTSDAKINKNKLYEHAYEQARLLDDLVDLEIEYGKRIIDKINKDPEPDEEKAIELRLWENIIRIAESGRRTGGGITGLADALAALGIRYGSKESFDAITDLMSTKMEAELDATIDLAILRGTFKGWDKDKEFIIFSGNEIWSGANDWYDYVFTQFPEQTNRMIKYGRRNINFSTIAPAGSVSILTQTSSGCEPLFQPYYTRRKKINPNDVGTRVDYVDDLGDKWQEYFVLHPKFKDWLYLQHNSLSIPRLDIISSELIPPEQWGKDILEEAFKYSPWYKSCANDINWKDRVYTQGLLQRFVTSAISSTTNVPKDTTSETLYNIYMEAWKSGCKGITSYIEGSRSGVLVTEPSTPKFKYYNAVKRPKKTDGEAFLTKVKGEDFTVFVGRVDGNVYEIFAYKGNGLTGEGKIVKKARGHYVFVQDAVEFEITDNLTDEQEAITRGYSWGLRHGGGIEFAVEQLNKTKGSLVGFNKALARVLKKYIPKDAVVSDKTCPSCGEDSLVYEESCLICRSCGYGKC